MRRQESSWPIKNELRKANPLIDFVDFHGLVDGERGITDGRIRGGRIMPCRDAESLSRTVDRIGVAVPFGARQGKRAGGKELVERPTFAVQCDVGALRFGNLQEFRADANEADRLCGGGALVGSRHLLQIDFVHTKQESTGDENTGQATHEFILPPAPARCKSVVLARVRIGYRYRLRSLLRERLDGGVATAQANPRFRLTVREVSSNNNR